MQWVAWRGRLRGVGPAQRLLPTYVNGEREKNKLSLACSCFQRVMWKILARRVRADR